MNTRPARQPLTPAEQDVLHAARARDDRCVCGEIHENDDFVTPATIGRMKAYLAEHSDHQFVVDETAGLIAVITTPAPNSSGPLRIVAQSGDLFDLLNHLRAPPPERLS